MRIDKPIALPPYALTAERADLDRDSLDTDAIIRFTRRSWRLCLVWILVGLCVGAAYAMVSPAYYTAYATLLLEDRVLEAPAARVASTDPTNTAYIDSQVQVLQSDEVAERVVDQNRLMEDEEFGKPDNGMRALAVRAVRSLLGSGSLTKAPEPRHATVLRVRRALSIRRVGMSNAVEIGFTSRDRVRAAAIATAIIRSYVDGRLEMERQARQDAASSLRQRLAEIRDKAFATVPPQDTSLSTPESGVEARAHFHELQSTTETYRALYSSLLQRVYSAADTQVSSPSARVITSAEPPLQPSQPRLILVFAVAVLGGAAAGISHALLRLATGRPLMTVEDIQWSTDLDQIVGIPKLSQHSSKIACTRRDFLQPVYMSVAADLYRAMDKVAVMLQRGENRPKGLVIAVAAPTRGAGASSVAVHLARIIAESGQRTLLVDANWQKSSVADAALTAQLDRPHVKALTATPLCDEDLDVLILRPTAPISELNASLSILATLQDQMPRYDCLVIDFQSAERTGDLAVSMGVIAEICVVLEAGRTTPESLRGFLQLIPRDKVAAIILNKITAGMTRAPLDINLTPPSGAGKDAGRGKGHD